MNDKPLDNKNNNYSKQRLPLLILIFVFIVISGILIFLKIYESYIKEIIPIEYQKNIKTLGNPVFSRVFLCFGFIKNLYEKGSIYMRETQVTHMCNTRKTVSCARFLMSCARYFNALKKHPFQDAFYIS